MWGGAGETTAPTAATTRGGREPNPAAEGQAVAAGARAAGASLPDYSSGRSANNSASLRASAAASAMRSSR